MPYPGAAFALAVGVALGAAVYYYFFSNEEKPQKHSQNTYDRAGRPAPVRRNNAICCTICLEEISVVTPVRALSCGHVFHCKCVAKWIKDNKNCPNCRTYQSH